MSYEQPLQQDRELSPAESSLDSPRYNANAVARLFVGRYSLPQADNFQEQIHYGKWRRVHPAADRRIRNI